MILIGPNGPQFILIHFRMNKVGSLGMVDMLEMVDKMDMVDDMNMVDSIDMVDNIYIVNMQKTFGYFKLDNMVIVDSKDTVTILGYMDQVGLG